MTKMVANWSPKFTSSLRDAFYNYFRIGFAALFMLSAISGCTKKREAKFSFGSGEGLLVVSDFDQKEFWLKTKNEFATTRPVSESQNQELESPEFQEVGIIDYTTNSELMQDIPFYGSKNKEYKLIYELTNHHLKIFKVVAPSELTIQEETIAEPVQNNENVRRVPIVGYPITGFFEIVRNKKDTGEETSQLIEKRVEDKRKATHFRIDRQNRELFTSSLITDLFQASFFEGDWYYSGAITATHYMSQNFYAWEMSQDQFGNEAGKVRFQKTQYAINFINLNVDPKFKETISARHEMQANVISIPATWMSFKTTERGASKGLRQEVDASVPWSRASYVKVDFKSAQSALSLGGNSILSDLALQKDFFSFVLTDKESRLQVRHSFLRAKERNYQPKVYHRSDEKKFGFFFTQKASIAGPDKHTESDFTKDYLVNRFNPKNKKITFYLSKGSPTWTKPAVDAALQEWNKVFSTLGIELTLAQERKNLGDIRYNIINMISQPDATFRWGGYGPRLTDPETGEIISSTSNVPVAMYVNSSLSFIRRMADHAQGLIDRNSLIGEEYPANEIYSQSEAGSASAQLHTISGLLNLERVLHHAKETKFEFKLAQPELKVKDLPRLKLPAQTAKRKFKLQNEPEMILGQTHANLIDDVFAQCPDVKKYIENLKPDSVRSSSSDEYKLFMPCALKVSQQSIVATLLHELGHNFGLRHNFFGSVDVSDLDWSKGIRSSSVMDYLNQNAESTKLGPYDIAAIRWAYADQVEVASQSENQFQFVQLQDSSLSIEDNLKNMNTTRKEYLYCSDEHVDLANYDSLCARQDIGRTPLEVVENLIREFNYSFAVNLNRNGRERFISAPQLALFHVNSYFIPLKRHYDQWRFKLAEFVGKENGYLETLTLQQYQEILNRMQKDPKFGPYYKMYRPAADRVANFFLELAFLPDRYCLIDRPVLEMDQDEKKAPSRFEARLEPLEKVMAEVFEATGQQIKSCKAPEYAALLANQNSKTPDYIPKVLGEVGYFVNSIMKGVGVQNSVDARKLFSHNRGSPLLVETNGTTFHRLYAMLLLTDRFPTSFYNRHLNLYPTIIDEPQYNLTLENLLLNRIITGTDVRTLTRALGPVPDAPTESDRKFISKNFANERWILGFMFSAFKWGQIVPTSTEITNQRLSRFFPMPLIGRGEVIENLESMGLNVEMVELAFGQGYFASERSDIAFHLIRALKNLTQLRYSMSTEGDMVESVKNLLSQRLTDKSGISKFTLQAHLDLISAINIEAGNMIRAKSQNGLQLLRVLSMEWQIFDRAYRLWLKEANISEDEQLKLRKEPISKVMLKVNEMIARKNELLKAQDRMPLFKEEIYYADEYKTRIGDILKRHDLGHRMYRRDQSDFDSQYDLILSLLMGAD